MKKPPKTEKKSERKRKTERMNERKMNMKYNHAEKRVKLSNSRALKKIFVALKTKCRRKLYFNWNWFARSIQCFKEIWFCCLWRESHIHIDTPKKTVDK